MKSLVIAVICAVFVGCGVTVNTTTPTQPDDPTTQSNKTLLTQSAWCSSHTPTTDYYISAYVFRPDGTVRFLSWKPSTKDIEFEKEMTWSLSRDVLQISTEVGSREGRLVTFSGVASKATMTWNFVEKTNENWSPSTTVRGAAELSQCLVPEKKTPVI